MLAEYGEEEDEEKEGEESEGDDVSAVRDEEEMEGNDGDVEVKVSEPALPPLGKGTLIRA